ncbi:hypothetical protein EC988_000051 [Linderina pennispora]|nr:hypothetical protein EC988_000051 [Linderina pennispora]
MQFADSPEDRAYIDLCLSGLSDDTKNLLPFGDPDAFMQLVRMSPLMFFKLVELLEPHKAFHGRMSKQREVAFQVALILIRLGNNEGDDTHIAAPYRMEQFVPLFERSSSEQAMGPDDKGNQGAALAIGQTGWMWKSIFRQLNALSIRIQSEKSLKDANSTIVATVYLFNYLQPTPDYVHPDIADLFLFDDEREFIKTVRMPLLKFFQLIDIIQSHPSTSIAFSKMKKKTLIHAVCVVLNRFGTIYDHSYSVAERFKLAEVSLRTYTDYVLRAILDIFKDHDAPCRTSNYISSYSRSYSDSDSASASDLEEGEIRTAPKRERRCEVVGLTTVRLHYKPAFQTGDYIYDDKLMSTREFGVRVLAAISPSRNWLRVLVSRPAVHSESELLKQSAVFDAPQHTVRKKEHGNLPGRKEAVDHITTLWQNDQKILVRSHTRHQPLSAYKRRADEHAIEKTFDAWKTVFRSLDALPVRIRSPKSQTFVSDWISATGYLYNFISPDEKYVELLRRLDEEDVTICTPLFDVVHDSNLSDSGEEEEIDMGDEADI